MWGTQSKRSDAEGQDQGGAHGQDRHDREPHPADSETPASHQHLSLGQLRDALHLQPQPEHDGDHKSNPTSPLATCEEDVRHRLEAVVRRALSLSDIVAPAGTSTTAPASTTAGRADSNDRTAPSVVTGITSSEPAPLEPGVLFSEPSPLSETASPSLSQEESRAQHEGIWRSQNPFEAQPSPLVPQSSASPPGLTEPFPSLPTHLPNIGESDEGSRSSSSLARRHADRPSIYFEGHIRDALPRQHRPQQQEEQQEQNPLLATLRPFVQAIMAFEKGRKFSTGTSVHRRRKMSTLVEKEGAFGPALTVCFFTSHLLFMW